MEPNAPSYPFLASVLTGAPSTIVKEWDQPGCPPAGEWIERVMIHLYYEILSCKEKNGIMNFSAKKMEAEKKIILDPERQILPVPSHMRIPASNLCLCLTWRTSCSRRLEMGH